MAGAAAVNNVQSKTKAFVKDSSITNANKFKVNAVSGGTQVAAGMGLEAVKKWRTRKKLFIRNFSFYELY